MLPLIIIIFQCFNDHLKVLFISQEIGIGCIDKKRFYIMFFDIVSIGLLNIEKIFVRDILFIRPVTLLDILLQTTYRSMQVNKQIRLQQLLVYDLK